MAGHVDSVTLTTLVRRSEDSHQESLAKVNNFSQLVVNFTNTTLAPPPNPYLQSWYVQAVYVTAFVAMVLCAAGGNAVVTWIVLAHRRMRTVTNYFLVNLAVADLLISLLNTPLCFIYMLSSSWPFGIALCRLTIHVQRSLHHIGQRLHLNGYRR